MYVIIRAHVRGGGGPSDGRPRRGKERTGLVVVARCIVVGVRQVPVLIVCPLSRVACALLGTSRPRNTHGN